MPILSSSSGLSARALGLTSGIVAGPLTINSISGILNSTTGTQLSVSFSPGIPGSSPITNYEFSLNNGSTFTPFSPAQTTSPLIISGLTNGTTYTVKIRSLQGNQSSEGSNAVSGRPVALPAAPTITAITNDGNGTTGTQISVAFTAGAAGTDATSNYQYSIDGGSTFTNRTTGTTESPMLITGLTNGTTYSVRIRAITSQSHSSLSSNSVSGRPVALPGAPTITSIAPLDSQISVAFTAGSAGTDATTNYQYSIDDGSTFTSPSPAVTTSPLLITGLTNGTTYSVRLRALTSNNQISSSSSVVTGRPVALTGAPTITSITNDGNGTTGGHISVAFAAGAAGTDPTTNYQYSLNNGSTYTSFSPAQTSSPLLITGLTNGTTYQVRIRSLQNTAEQSNMVSGRPVALPAAPTITTITNNGNGTTGTQISVAFTAGAAGTDATTNYQFSIDDGSTFTNRSTGTTASPLLITGLTNGTTYSVRIRAVTSNNHNSSSSAAVSGRPVALPGAPTITSITNDANGITGGHISVAFTAGSVGTDATANYQFSIDGGSTFTSPSPAVTTSPLLITGLTNGTTYSVAMRAVTSNNQNSSPSSAVSGRPVALPVAPTITTITNDGNGTTGTRISVAFTAGSAGTDATSNYQFSIDGGSTFTNRTTGTTASPLLITGLTNGTTYSVRIRAVTSINHNSSSSSAVSGRPVALPGTDTITGIAASTGQLSIAFTQGTSGTDARLTYQFSLNNGSTFTNRATGTVGSPLVVTGITDSSVVNGSYTVKIRSITNQNHLSAQSNAVVPVATPADAPVITTTSKTPTSITVNFTNAVAGSYAILDHELSLDYGDFENYTSGTARTDLLTSTSYTARIRAVDVQLVTGQISETTITTDAEVAPSAPVIGATTETSTTSITVAYTRGAQGTYPINSDERRVYYYTNNGYVLHSDWTTVTSPFTVTGLPNPDYSYLVQVRSKSTQGLAGAYSEVNVMTKAPIPSAPVLSFSLTSASERATASLSWTAPTYATKYHVYKNGVYLKEVTGTTTTAAVNENAQYNFTVYAGNRHDQFSGVSNTKTMNTGQYLVSNTWLGQQGERMVIRTDAPPAGCSAPIRFSITVSSNTNDPGTAGYARIDTVSAAWRCGARPAVGTTDYTAGQNADRDPLCNPTHLRLQYGLTNTQAWGSTFDSFFITRSYSTGGVSANALGNGELVFQIGAVAGKNLNSNCTVNNIGDYWIAKEFKAVGKITTATTYS